MERAVNAPRDRSMASFAEVLVHTIRTAFAVSVFLLAGSAAPAYPQELRAALERHVVMLSDTIGERNFREYANLEKAADYVQRTFAGFGYTPVVHSYYDPLTKKTYRNIVARKTGTETAKIFVVGAHYDSPCGSPGADDNASGVAVLLEMARYFADRDTGMTIEFAAFANEEYPFFKTDRMGSKAYADGQKKRNEPVAGMISLEMLGFYTGRRGSQEYPSFLMKLFYPNSGSFIAFVSQWGSRALKNRIASAFAKHSTVRASTLAAPVFVPGIDQSDHWAYWQNGYDALMVTDTAYLRNPYYHTAFDTADMLDFRKMTEVCKGLCKALEEYCGGGR